MPAPVSKRQYRYMMAILHGDKNKTSSRGDRVPASVASKYSSSSDESGGLPESKGKAHAGGKWTDAHHEKHKKKSKKDLKKALEQYLIDNHTKAAGCVVLDSNGKILLGKRTDTGQWATPGGKVEPHETHEEGALRELREEANIVCVGKPKKISEGKYRGYETQSFLVDSFKGKIKDNKEMVSLRFFDAHEIPWDQMTDYAKDSVMATIEEKLKKSKNIKYMLAIEKLQKNTIRSGGSAPHDVIHEVTHGDALRMVGNGTFRKLRSAVKDMTDEEVRDIQIDNYKLSIRKHVNDIYSGRVTDGHKQIHQFTNKSLPSVAVELMSIFEWYLPEDEGELEILDENQLDDLAIEGGMQALVENYKRHNIVNIYSEMENIRSEIRNGMAIDLQQIEQKIMKLFDKLEDTLLDVTDKHNTLTQDVGVAVDELEQKLRSLQDSIDKLNQKPTTMQAFSSNPADGNKVHQEYYPYLSKPQVVVSPDGRITISFSEDWTQMERADFLKDMRAKAIKKAGN